VLQFAGVTDSVGDWIAGDCTLVQTGDLIDRGHDSIAVLKLFEELKEKAAAAGGEVITLMGNHELLSIQVLLHHSNPSFGLIFSAFRVFHSMFVHQVHVHKCVVTSTPRCPHPHVCGW
jgi:hypothetical protein